MKTSFANLSEEQAVRRMLEEITSDNPNTQMDEDKARAVLLILTSEPEDPCPAEQD